VANGNNRIDLSWTITGPDVYEIYRRTATGTFALIGSTSFNTFSDTTADGGVTYFYMVSNGCGATNTASAMALGACGQPPTFGGAAAAWQTGAGVCTVQVSWAAGTSPCGGTVSYSVYRDTTPAIVPSLSTRLGTNLSPTSYLDSASLSAGMTYYYIVRATSSANNEEDQNTVVQAATPTGCTTSAPPPVQFFDVRSGNFDNTLEWVNPVAGYDRTILRFRTDTYPTSVTDGNPVPNVIPGIFIGSPGVKDRTTHAGLGNGTTYYYAAFVEDGAGTASSGKTSLGRPDTMTGSAKWGYATAAAALATSGVIPNRGYYVVSNDRVLHSNDRGTGGGTWPGPWYPAPMNGPSQGRPMVVALPTTTVMGASRIAVASSQDGRVYAFNADSGAVLWKSDVLGAAVQASPSGLFKDFGGVADLVLVGTREPTGDSKFYALNLANGSEAWHFDNGGTTNGIGIITGQAQVQYPDRVYFTSRRKGGGSQNTVWCLQFNATTDNISNPPVKLWAQNHNDTDAGPVLRNNVLYVGNIAGEVRALNPANGNNLWTGPYLTGDGPVKGYIWVQQIAGNTRLFFSTTNNVHAVRDNGTGTAPSSFWTGPQPIGNVSPPYFLNGRVYVGGNNNRVYSIDAMLATPPLPNTVILGDPAVSKIVGSPTVDTINQVLLVGTDQGLVYSVQLPF
jgi:outer membrane protein assembly factor BamB